jgi:hypothetical protein
MPDTTRLTFKEHVKLITREIGLNLPYVKYFFNWYFSYEDAKEIKRIEGFIEKLAMTIEELKFKVDNISEDNKATIVLALNKVIRNISTEIIEEKRQAYLNYLKNLFKDSQNDDIVFNEHELFLSTLENITLLEIQILKIVNKLGKVNTQNIYIDGVDSYLIQATCQNLKNKGLLLSGDLLTIVYNPLTGHIPVSDVQLSEFGNRFFKYCLENES